MQDTIYFIYKLSFDGHSYIGVSKNPEKRWYEHRIGNSSRQSSTIHKAITEHRWDNFTKEIICCTKDRSYAFETLEPYFIKLHRAHVTQGGYNRTTGGEAGRVGNFSPEHRDKLRKAQTGRKLSETTKRKISDAIKGKPHPWKAHPLPERTKQLLSASKKGRPSKRKGRQFGSNKGHKTYIIKLPDSSFITITNLMAFCKQQNIGRVTLFRSFTTNKPTKEGFQVIHVE